MNKFISNLRSKSDLQKRQILFVSLFIVMSLIISLWVYSITNNFEKDNTVVVETKKDISPFKLLTQKMNESYKNMSASVSNAGIFNRKNEENITTDDNLKDEKTIDLIPVYK